MDEVENPNLPSAGEASPTLRPIDDEDDSAIEDGSPPKPPPTTTESPLAAGESPRRAPASPRRLDLPARPPLRREGTAPPIQPPPAPPEPILDSPQDQPDSLTLADLKRIRRDFPTAVLPAKQELLDCDSVYDFQYEDAESLPVELEEWFTYSDEEQSKLRKCKVAFNEAWRATEEGKADWLDVTEDMRRGFLSQRIEYLAQNYGGEGTASALMILTYVGLGVWEETAGRREGYKLEDLFVEENGGHMRMQDFASSSLQLRWIVAMVDTLHACDGLKAVYDALRKTCDKDFQSAPVEQSSFRNEPQPRRPEESVELWCCLTLMYLFIEVARTTAGESGQRLKGDIVALEPNLLNYLTHTVSRLRWDDTAPIPLAKMFLLAWKAILVSVGGIKDVERVKSSLREDKDKDKVDVAGQPLITASPLDYHLFRQEISSKYPAYQAPPPLFPLEPENNSILPPLKHRSLSYASSDSAYMGAPSVGTESIMHQPVHIATPAPSPPPTPGGPGKAGKKQNYQTNQMFPFLYPPLDLSSNEIGGKGDTQLQDALVGRKWMGSDVPASILEAAELFSKRMRATRAMKQLWEARVDFMRYERGWKPSDGAQDDEGEFEIVEKTAPEETAEQGQPLLLTDEQRRLAAVAAFYKTSLPHLQSVIIVLLKATLQYVTDIVSKNNGQNGLQPGIQFSDVNGMNGSIKPLENGTADAPDHTAEEVDKLRTQEVASKAISGILILLLKWLKVSHILQYEYMTQLLLDSNYVPLILKMWQTHDIAKACHTRWEKEELNFFHFCQANSRAGPPTPPPAAPAEDSSDEAIPPPIKFHRDSSLDAPLLSPTTTTTLDPTQPPEVDELGYPTTPLPTTPITTYSYRNVISSINHLRVLQKVTRRKTHRALLLVSYKSSNHLKRTLKIPIRALRYYTLKLFKSQVPFCGRKWRQGNMKIITAVWLSVPAELRDDWLSGGGGGMGGACVGDVDGTVEDALPLEQSLRALTHWWNLRNFPEVMGFDTKLLEEEMEVDYFTRELEKMDLGREGGEGEFLGDEERLAEDAWPAGEGY
ncbi:hypothetical protein BDY17DRAFT_349694 [Neohortaea acidophila]|uniref:Factor arrest protein 11 n=1 Tax=Neohortaea acidophila TaxID=245834 RepID=A0A6A6PFC2_9PEZI|nr:uncharacterized protein BDY17DRAFT_349694 [Neohortaea acidophila]KAF2478650.1 hypothetical protein BDY17DRAFT_349694 [Neohortaea acidophila]